MAREAAEAAGVGLAWVEIKGPRSGRRLCVFIEREADAVGLADCERVNHALSAMLDVEDPFRGPYTLEVSTPGLFRPLRSLADCERFLGRRIRVRYRDGDRDSERSATLARVEGGVLHLGTTPKELAVAWSAVAAARLDPDVAALLRRGARRSRSES